MREPAQIAVLVVDNEITSARAYGDLIRHATDLPTQATDDPDEALALVQENSVSVLVLDQKMPAILGTDLYELLRPYAPHAQAIMFTAFGGEGAAGRLVELDYAKFLDKKDIRDLPSVVVDLHGRAMAAQARSARIDEDLFVAGRWGRRRRTVRVVSALELDARYIDSDEWRPLVNLTAGEEHRVVIERSSTRKTTFEKELQEQVTQELGLEAKQLAGLKAKLEARFQTTNRLHEEYAVSRASKLEQSLKLDQPADTSKRFVQALFLEYAPTYRRLQVVVAATCGHCAQTGHATVVLRQSTGLIALRQTNYWSDGTEETKRTGFRSL